MIGKFSYIVFADKKIEGDPRLGEVLLRVQDFIERSTEYKVTASFDIEYVDFENDSVRHLEWKDNSIPDWWMNREYNYISDKWGEKYNQALYLIDESNWGRGDTSGGFNKGVNRIPGGLHIGMDFVRWSDLIAKHLNISFEEGVRIAITEELAHDLDNWGQYSEPQLDLPEFFGVGNLSSTQEGSSFDTFVVHARLSSFPRWDHSHIFYKLRDHLAQWFECQECEEIKPMETYLVIHHSAGGKNETIQTVRDLHWPKYQGTTWYQIIIDRDGKIWREHEIKRWRGFGKYSVDVCVLGDFTQEDPTQAQIQALQSVVRELRGRHSFEAELGHKELWDYGLEGTESACPGNLMDYLNWVDEDMYKLVLDPDKAAKGVYEVWAIKEGIARRHIANWQTLVFGSRDPDKKWDFNPEEDGAVKNLPVATEEEWALPKVAEIQFTPAD